MCAIVFYRKCIRGKTYPKAARTGPYAFAQEVTRVNGKVVSRYVGIVSVPEDTGSILSVDKPKLEKKAERDRRYWTQEQLDTLIKNRATSSNRDLASGMGRSTGSISHKLSELRKKGLIQSVVPRKIACKLCTTIFETTSSVQLYCSKEHRLLAIRNLRITARRTHSNKLRDAALFRYGGQPPTCACCGESNKEFLSLDHVKNDGNLHRKTFTGSIYQWMKNNNYPNGFQVLCHNCNFAKAWYTECPHKRPKTGG